MIVYFRDTSVNIETQSMLGALLSLAFCARMVVKRSWVSSVGQHAREAVAGANRAVGRVAPSRSISMPIR